MGKTGTDIRVTVQCTGCDAPLKRYPDQVKRSRSGRWFCSLECRDKVGSKPRRKAMQVCATCEESFYPRSGNLNKYCSKECHAAARRVGQVKRACRSCGKVVMVAPSKDTSYCSRVCYEVGRGTPIGSRRNTDDGYVMVFQPDSPEAWKGDHRKFGWALEHRVVMAEMLGHPLPQGSTIHHRNGIRHDNRPENLEFWASYHKPGQRVLDLLEHAHWILDTFGPDEARLREIEAS